MEAESKRSFLRRWAAIAVGMVAGADAAQAQHAGPPPATSGGPVAQPLYGVPVPTPVPPAPRPLYGPIPAPRPLYGPPPPPGHHRW